MRYDRLDEAVAACRAFAQAAEKLRKDVRAERLEFPDHKFIDITHARQTAEVRSRSKDLSDALTKLRQKT